jgi:hypothetical protein
MELGNTIISAYKWDLLKSVSTSLAKLAPESSKQIKKYSNAIRGKAQRHNEEIMFCKVANKYPSSQLK